MPHPHETETSSSGIPGNLYDWESYDNPFRDFLEYNPNIAFQAHGEQGRFGQTQSSRNFFQNQFSNIHNQFLGQIGQQILGSEAPTRRFTDFLDDFDFEKFSYGFTPGQRGQSSARYTPRTRFIPQG
jgi:hypothetical protein